MERDFVRTVVGRLIFWERKRASWAAMAADLSLGRRKEVRGFLEEGRLSMQMMVAACFSGKVGFQLLAQPTEITTKLFIIYKQWHT